MSDSDEVQDRRSVAMGTEVVTVATGDGPPHDVRPFLVYPIGKVCKRGPTTAIEVESRHRDGLMGLGDFSHVWVFYWLDQNDIPEKRGVLRVHPRGDECNPLTGVFATRAPQPDRFGLVQAPFHQRDDDRNPRHRCFRRHAGHRPQTVPSRKCANQRSPGATVGQQKNIVVPRGCGCAKSR